MTPSQYARIGVAVFGLILVGILMAWSAANCKDPIVSVVPVKSDTVRGTYIIWYSNIHKTWRATTLNGPIYNLTNTSMIDHLASSTKHYPGYQKESGCNVSYIAELELRYLKTDREPAPGDIPSMEVVRVDLVRTDFCFHDEHAPKARRE